MGDKRITADEAAKARKLIEKYDEQCHAERMKQWDDRNKWLAEMAGDFAGNAALEAWAEAKRESDKAKGIDTKMEPDMARAWNLKCLRNAVADVCQAFDIPVGEIVNRPRKETTNERSDAGRTQGAGGVTAMTDEKAIEAAADAMRRYAHDNGIVRSLQDYAQAAIAAYFAQREADGFVMVPVEPTPHMKEEALFANDNALLMSADCTDVGNAYRAMIAARPKG